MPERPKFTIHLALITLFGLTLAMGGSARASEAHVASWSVGREPMTVDFGDFQAKAELDYPIGVAHAPVVVMVAGASPEDMDADIRGASGQVSHIYLDIANYLATHGIAVMRYNKHYVNGFEQVDPRFYEKLDLQQMLADAGKILARAKSDSHVDSRHTFVYGWSEGSMIAAALVRQHPELSGVVFQGAVAESPREFFTYQYLGVGLSYLRRFVPEDQITAAALQAAWKGKGGLVAKSLILALATNVSSGDFTPRPFWDTNHDGSISIQKELLPNFPHFLDLALSPNGLFSIYGPGRVLPSVTEQAPYLRLPVLILQGEDDANVPPEGAGDLDQALEDAGNRDHLLQAFPGVGHSLGPAPSPVEDDFRPITEPPMRVLGRWLVAHS